MAPDLEKKREPRRATDAGAFIHEDIPMLVFSDYSDTFSDYYGQGTNIGVAGVSPVIGTELRNGITLSRPHSSRRANQQRHHHHNQHQRHPDQPGNRKSSTSSINGVIARSSDDIGTAVHDICDNSNDSGLGFDERQQQHLNKTTAWSGAVLEETKQTEKRRKMDIKLESEDANFAFPEGSQSENKSTRHRINGINSTISRQANSGAIGRVIGVTRPRPAVGVLSKRPQSTHQGPVTLTSPLASHSRDGKVQLQILCQPEQQHRARYQTEGSRGAVKDRTGNSFPIVRLLGYDKPATLQVFIGTDLGRPVPHMFYQACRVSGKNSTICSERKIDGTIVIEVDMDPSKDMVVTCDCVGILKERNVDVEHRFPHEAGVLQGRSKKKSTRCRMVFRTTITLDDGSSETLQVCSQPIVCTQPPGIPEICKKSLTSCPCTGGLELFVFGKNFLKDTRIVFQLDSDNLPSKLEAPWECTVLPDKEYLQQTHLVCVVPPYRRQDLAPSETVAVRLFAVSSGKTSEPHAFDYTAASTPPEPTMGRVDSTSPIGSTSDSVLSTSPVPMVANVSPNAMISQGTTGVTPNFLSAIQPSNQTPTKSPPEIRKTETSSPPVTVSSQVNPVMMWSSQATNCQSQVEDVMMPPPHLGANPLLNRRASTNVQLILPDNLKTEVLDENSQNSMLNENSMSGIINSSLSVPTVQSPLDQLVNESSRDGNPNIMRTVTNNGTPVQDALLEVVDLMRNQHPMAMVPGHATSFGNVHEPTQVKVLSPHHINKDANSIISSEVSTNGTVQGAGVVDLRMKHHTTEFNGLGNYAAASSGPLPAQSGQSIEKYLNHIESNAQAKDAESQDTNFVRASIIASNRQQQQQQQQSLVSVASVKLNDLVNSTIDTHQMVSPLKTSNTTQNMMVHVEHETISSPQQTHSPPMPVKTLLLEPLFPNPNMTSLVKSGSTAVGSSVPIASEQSTRGDLLNTINTAMLNPMQDPAAIDTSGSTNGGSTVPIPSSSKILPSSAAIQQMQVMAQDAAVIQAQQAQQVEQVVAHAQQQVEQVVAKAQQQAVQVVQSAQQHVVHQVVQHAQVVQQAVQKVQAVQQVPDAPALQQAVEQESQEAVQQAVQQATQEVVQQVQAVQQAVQQAQAAQAMQQAVQQDIGSMLNQPAGFVSEASSVLAIGASHEPSQQRLTNAAEHAINEVITNATQDIINNRPISTTTAHAIIATKNILNSVATQSAALMNNAMEVILPKSPAQTNIVDQVATKSPPAAVPMPTASGRQPVNATMANATANTTNNVVGRKPEDSGGMLPQELTSMSDHDLLSYINPSCFDAQGGFLM